MSGSSILLTGAHAEPAKWRAEPFQNMSGDPEQEYFADGMVGSSAQLVALEN
jgi:TolB-like protein